MKSNLATYENLTKHHSGKRKYAITRITPHCFVGQVTAKRGCDYFVETERDCSSNYVIGKDGEIGVSVLEENRSWCSSSRDNDNRAITIECASDKEHPFYVNEKVFESLVDLCVDICRRYDKDTLLWIDDKEKTLSYEPEENEMIITIHRWFSDTSCPGEWLLSRLPELAKRVTDELQPNTFYCVQVGAYVFKENAEKMLQKLKNQGFDGYITTKVVKQ